MKPLRLELTAFGPFPGREELDFGSLPEDSLFLIHGPTGSGKTTILDAICYALYGDTSSEDRAGSDMRCHLADPATLTEIAFEFRLGDERLRVERVPDQRRPKKRGGGFTDQIKQATLLRLEPDGSPGRVLATGWGKVTLALGERLGLDSRQFRQVVLLPQGQFRRLLLASSQDREEILKRLFDTARFAELEAALKHRAGDLRQRASALAERRRALLEEAARGAGWEAGDDQAPTDAALAEARSALSESVREAGAAAAEAKEGAELATRALQSGESAARVLTELADARGRRAALEERRGAHESRLAELDAARRGRQVAPAAKARDAARAAEQRGERAQAQAEEALAGARSAAETAAASLGSLRAPEAESEREAAADRVRELRGLRDAVRSLDEARRRHEAAAAGERKAREQETALREKLDGLKVELATAQEETGRHAAAKELLEPLQAALERAEAACTDAEQLDLLRREEAGARTSAARAAEALREAEERARRATAERDALRAAWQTGQAARLADALSPEEPCPVCGSLEHPAPARAGDEIPDDARVERADEAAEESRRAAETARAEASRTEALRDAAASAVERESERLGPAAQRTADELRAQREAARRKLQEARESASREEAAARLAADLRSRLETAEAALAEAKTRADSASGDATRAAGELTGRQDRVPDALRPAGALDAALREAEHHDSHSRAALDEAVGAAGRAGEDLARAEATAEAARAGREQAKAAADEAARGLVDVLAREGFSDEASFAQAARDDERTSELERERAAFERERAAIEEVLARSEAAGRDLEAPDLGALGAAAKAAHAAHESRAEERAALAERLRAAEAAQVRLGELAAEQEELEKRFGPLGTVAALASGDNAKRLSLHRFVLSALLDEVLEVASRRLSSMSRRRYALRRAEDPRDARRQAGLELEVDDAWTGIARPVSTLSGGESFLAALSLALALADVVQSHAGGLRLETLFIDEGFGSLDPDSLDLALSTLVKLGADGGRLVGVISHVTELDQRIAHRLEVRSGAAGSTARFVLP